MTGFVFSRFLRDVSENATQNYTVESRLKLIYGTQDTKEGTSYNFARAPRKTVLEFQIENRNIELCVAVNTVLSFLLVMSFRLYQAWHLV